MPPMPKHPIHYLVSDAGAAKTNSRKGAALLISAGFRECSPEGYAKQLRWQVKKEERAAREEMEAHPRG